MTAVACTLVSIMPDVLTGTYAHARGFYTTRVVQLACELEHASHPMNTVRYRIRTLRMLEYLVEFLQV